MQSVNIKNWSYSRYLNGDFMALVTFGADPDSVSNNCLEYYVTVLENETHEAFQEKFDDLASACMFLNTQYGDWTFEDQTAAKSGCSTCAAH